MKTNPYIIDYYNNYDEDSRLSPRHGTVEFLTTMRYIEKYIKPGSRVLEIGAGTGRYSQGNALDLSAFSDNQYDITLLLGPLYHLYTKKDKRQALGEAIRVTKQGGIIFAAYVISDGCLLDEGFNRGNINAAEYIKNGLLDPETFAAKSEPKDLFELVRKEDIDDLMSIFPTTRLHYAAADGCALLIREAIDKMDDETFKLYLKYHYATCERKDLTGITSHAIDIFQK